MAKSPQKMGVKDITSIKCSAKIGKESKEWTFVSPFSAYTSINTWYGALPLGTVDWSYDMEINLAGNIVKQTVEISDYQSYPEFIRLLRQVLADNDLLADVPLNRASDVHVSWNNRLSQFIIRRKNPQNTIPPFRTSEYRPVKGNDARFSLWVELLEGYDWTLDFTGVDGIRHYYSGKIEHIQKELIRIASNNLKYVGQTDTMYPSDAVIGLRELYTRYPEWIERLGSFDLRVIAELTLPGKGFYVQREARKLMDILPHRMANSHIMSVIEQVEIWLDKMYDYQGIVINRPSGADTSFENDSDTVDENDKRKIIKVDMRNHKNPTSTQTLEK